MNNSASITPAETGAAILAALAALYKKIPLTDEEAGQLVLLPQEQWEEGLADKVQELLNKTED